MIFENKKMVLLVFLVAVAVTPLFVSAVINYYDPNETLQDNWNQGTGSTYEEIVDSARYDDIPDTSTYVAARSNQNLISEFGFPSPVQPTAMNVTLWVFVETESNAQFSFSLRQGTTDVCSGFVPGATSQGWMSCTWDNPSGDLSDLRLYLFNVSRPGGGGMPMNTYVYASYLEVTENYPPSVSLVSPEDNYLTNQEIVDFTFIAEDDYDSELPECVLWANFSGSWEAVESSLGIPEGVEENISWGVPEGIFEWNVECTDTRGESSFHESNYTLYVDRTPPSITLLSPDDGSLNMTHNELSFYYEVSDDSEVSSCSLVINESVVDTDNNIERDTLQSFSETLDNGYYEWRVECVDSAGNPGMSATRNLTVSVYDPEITNIELPGVVNLNPGSTREVQCNISVYDENGADNIDSLFAEFYLHNASGSEPDNNTFYEGTCEQSFISGNTAGYSCVFSVLYYATNGTWHCNATVTNNQGFTGNDYNTTIVDELYAFNLSALEIDYGDVEPMMYSDEKELGVVNIGNQPLNVFMRGYGGDDPVVGEGVAMICDTGQNISLERQRYSLQEATLFDEKIVLTSSFEYSGLDVQKQTGPGEPPSGSLFWQLHPPPMQVSQCSGTIVVSATGS